MPTDQLHTTSPAARAADIAESTLSMWARRGLVPFQTTSTGVRLFKLEDVLRVAQERARRPQRRDEMATGVGV